MTKMIDHIQWIANYNYPVTMEDAENMIEDSKQLLNELGIPAED